MWIRMNQTYPQPPTEESKEGDAAHWCFKQLLDGDLIAEGLIAPNGVVITGEMVEGAELFADVVHARTGGRGNCETPVAIPSIHPQCWGTPDYDMSAPGVIELIDYKFGHRFVDEFENMQAIAYVAGILDRDAAFLGVNPGALDLSTVVNITIVQPRCYYRGAPVRTWTVNAADLRPHTNRLSYMAHEALSDHAKATTNEECRKCPGRHACPALQQGAYADAEYAYGGAPVELTPEAASLELRIMERALGRLEARVEGMREAVTAYARGGKVTPFHRLESSPGRSQWNVPIDQVIAIGNLYGASLAKPAVITPKQAEKLGVDGAVISAYSFTPSGSLKLIPENPDNARRIFGIK